MTHMHKVKVPATATMYVEDELKCAEERCEVVVLRELLGGVLMGDQASMDEAVRYFKRLDEKK